MSGPVDVLAEGVAADPVAQVCADKNGAHQLAWTVEDVDAYPPGTWLYPYSPSLCKYFLCEPEHVANLSLPMIELFPTRFGKLVVFNRKIGEPWPFPVATSEALAALKRLDESACNGGATHWPEDYDTVRTALDRVGAA